MTLLEQYVTVGGCVSVLGIVVIFSGVSRFFGLITTWTAGGILFFLGVVTCIYGLFDPIPIQDYVEYFINFLRFIASPLKA